LAELHIADEEQLDLATRRSFPALAAVGGHELQLGRYFSTIFINGLAAHSFPADAPIWRARLVAMLKECLTEFWVRRGVLDLDEQSHDASADVAFMEQRGSAADPAALDRQREALALLRKAMELLSDDQPFRDPAMAD
jgi:hypothetical protein